MFQRNSICSLPHNAKVPSDLGLAPSLNGRTTVLLLAVLTVKQLVPGRILRVVAAVNLGELRFLLRRRVLLLRQRLLALVVPVGGLAQASYLVGLQVH